MMNASELRGWLVVILIALVLIGFWCGLGAMYLRNLGQPTIVRQCITIDAPQGTTRVGCGS